MGDTLAYHGKSCEDEHIYEAVQDLPGLFSNAPKVQVQRRNSSRGGAKDAATGKGVLVNGESCIRLLSHIFTHSHTHTLSNHHNLSG